MRSPRRFSRGALPARFLGYVEAQARGLRGERHATRTRELSVAHGYDTKYAMHAMRIAHQGLELFETGAISLPMQEPTRSRLRAIRSGAVALPEVLAEIDELSDRLTHASKLSSLPPGPDDGRVNAFLADAYPRLGFRSRLNPTASLSGLLGVGAALSERPHASAPAAAASPAPSASRRVSC